MQFSWLTLAELQEDSLWWEIYFDSFPSHELDSRNQIENALQQQLAKIGRMQHFERTTAIAVLYPMKTLSFGFLNYIAIQRALRGQKIGQQLMQHLITETRALVRQANNNYLGLIWECEDPEWAKDEKQKTIQQRRLHFYRQLGAKMLPCAYLQPPIDGKNTVRMCLMAISDDDLSSQQQAIVECLYFEKYHVVNQIPRSLLENLLQASSSGLTAGSSQDFLGPAVKPQDEV